MLRIIGENILLFLLPTAAYVAYVYMTREERGGASRVLDDAPIVWLFVAGLAIVLVGLATFGSIAGGKPGQVYTPPAFKNGHIEPGHIE
jgi:hypothetical protein